MCRRAVLSLAFLPCAACLAEVTTGLGAAGADAGGAPQEAGGSGPYCDVALKVFVPMCTACHKPGGNYPDLTFEGAKAGLVGGKSQLYGDVLLVAPKDAKGSLLYRKIT